jgi:hypothetical protein
MEYEIFSHRNGLAVALSDKEKLECWKEILTTLDEITDEQIIAAFNNSTRETKSISDTLNKLIDESLVKKNWHRQSEIFKDTNYRGDAYRLDFAKGSYSVEVAFNHTQVAPWNLIKPVLASELNHVEKEIQTEIGIIICASHAMQIAGGFDNAIGTAEKYLALLKPMGNMLTAPTIIIALNAPKTFKIIHTRNQLRRYDATIEYLNN